MLRLFLFLISLLTLTVGCGALFNNGRPAKCNHMLSPFGGGSGTASDPYTICTVAHLMQVQNYLSSSFKQHADLDLAGNTTFTPIGSIDNPFTGTYDGNNFKISNWTFTGPTTNNVGIFSAVSDPVQISNLKVTNINLNIFNNGGAIVGQMRGTTASVISNCFSSGQIVGNGTGQYIGGLVGLALGGTIQSSGSTVSINAWANGGGLIGTVPSGLGITITNSYAKGSVTCTRSTGANYCGGLIGSANSGAVLVSNSYAQGSVLGENAYIGGLVGIIGGGTTTISNSYATGNASVSTGSGQIVGGLVGGIVNSGTATITRSYSTGSVAAQTNLGGLIGRVSSSATVSNSYSTSTVNMDAGGSSGGGLVGLGTNMNISTSYATGSVTGSATSQLVGGFAGSLNSSSVTDSYARGNAVGFANGAGGFIAQASASTTVTRCYSTGAVSGTTNKGGLIGQCSGCGAVTASYWDTVTSGQPASPGGGTAYDTGQMQTPSNFVGWDFTSTWNPPSTGAYPTLR